MALFDFLQGCRTSKPAPTSLDSKQTHVETKRRASNNAPRELPGLIVLPILIMICSLSILVLSIYGIIVFHGKRTGVTNLAPPNADSFPVDILVCSLCIAILGITTVLYQVVARKVERLYNCYVVFTLHFSILVFSVGTIAGYGVHAVGNVYFEGIRVFYSQIGLIIALLVLIVVCMILSGNPITMHQSSTHKLSKISLDEENAQGLGSPVVEAPENGLISHDGANDIPQSTTVGLTQLDAVHYNPADPYHPLRLNPPKYSEAMETLETTEGIEMSPSYSTHREQPPIVQFREVAPSPVSQGFPVSRDSSCMQSWVNWSRVEE